jgi:hypothetical protein
VDILTKFVLAFGLTLVALVGVLWTGLRWRVQRRRGLHLSLVVVTVGLLVFTIVLALELGHAYDLESAGLIYPVHMALARTATFSLLLPVATGIQVLRTGQVGRAHRAGAFSAFTLVALAAITGFWMVYLAEPLA